MSLLPSDLQALVLTYGQSVEPYLWSMLLKFRFSLTFWTIFLNIIKTPRIASYFLANPSLWILKHKFDFPNFTHAQTKEFETDASTGVHKNHHAKRILIWKCPSDPTRRFDHFPPITLQWEYLKYNSPPWKVLQKSSVGVSHVYISASIKNFVDYFIKIWIFRYFSL